MSIILDFLPMLEGWRETFEQKENIEISFESEILKIDNPGWIVAGALAINNPDTIVELRYTGRAKPRVTPRMLWTFNMTQPTNYLPYTTKPVPNDENIYTVVYEPSTLIPFKPPLTVKLIPPIGTSVRIIAFTYLLYEIIDQELFLKSLQKVLGTATQPMIREVETELKTMGIGGFE